VSFLQRHRYHCASLHIDRVFRLVGKMGPPIVHPRDARIPIVRISPMSGCELSSFACGPIWPSLHAWGLDPGLLRQTLQELFITLYAVSAHNRAQGGIRFQCGGVNADLLTFQQIRFRQEFQYPSEYLTMSFQLSLAAETLVLFAAIDTNGPSPNRAARSS
jgi:hypothetical protein